MAETVEYMITILAGRDEIKRGKERRDMSLRTVEEARKNMFREVE